MRHCRSLTGAHVWSWVSHPAAGAVPHLGVLHLSPLPAGDALGRAVTRRRRLCLRSRLPAVGSARHSHPAVSITTDTLSRRWSGPCRRQPDPALCRRICLHPGCRLRCSLRPLRWLPAGGLPRSCPSLSADRRHIRCRRRLITSCTAERAGRTHAGEWPHSQPLVSQRRNGSVEDV